MIHLRGGNRLIVNIVPGDFNGDSVIDMLVVYKISDTKMQMSLFLGNKTSRYDNDFSKTTFPYIDS